jgi:hypothetical protein
MHEKRRPAFQWWRGFRTITHLRATNPTLLLVTELALYSRPNAAALLNVVDVEVPRNRLGTASPGPSKTFGFRAKGPSHLRISAEALIPAKVTEKPRSRLPLAPRSLACAFSSMSSSLAEWRQISGAP